MCFRRKIIRLGVPAAWARWKHCPLWRSGHSGNVPAEIPAFFDDIDECVLDKDGIYIKVDAAVFRVLSSAQLEYDGRFSVYEEYLCGMGLVKSEMTRRIFHVFSEYFLNKTPGVTLPEFESNKLSDFLKGTIMFYGGSYIPKDTHYIPMPPAWRPLPLEGGRRYQEDCSDSREDFSDRR